MEFKYFVDNIDKANTGLFENHRVDGIKYLIKRFLRGQERGKLKDISNLVLPKYDYMYIQDFYIYYSLEFYDNPSYIEFFDFIDKLYNKIKIKIVFSDYYGEDYYV